MNTFLTPPSHRPQAAGEIPDNGLPASMNMDVPDLHALLAATAHGCKYENSTLYATDGLEFRVWIEVLE